MSPAACFYHRCGLDETETADAQRLLHVRSTITALPRTRVMTVTSEHICSECRSAVFKYIDGPAYNCTHNKPGTTYFRRPGPAITTSKMSQWHACTLRSRLNSWIP